MQQKCVLLKEIPHCLHLGKFSAEVCPLAMFQAYPCGATYDQPNPLTLSKPQCDPWLDRIRHWIDQKRNKKDHQRLTYVPLS